MELFGSKQLPPNSPIVVYVTGGYWSELSGELSAYTVGPMYAEGIVTAVLHYDRAPGGACWEINYGDTQGVSMRHYTNRIFQALVTIAMDDSFQFL